ncbi:MAG TPA: hypothetical protein VLF68_00600 [Candidatus Saccharimonadales bacterium]|nr:hypothetical protein [Candidatus Saccharimonadales bacterium]
MNRQDDVFEQRKHEMHQTMDGAPCIEENYPSPPKSPPDQKEISKQSQKFETLVGKSNRVLLKISGIFPFDLFPDSIVIDENKVNIIHRYFFFTDEVQSIVIPHIKDVLVDRALLFATLKILPDGFSENWVSVEYLWKEEAVRARRIILGLLVGQKEGIDITKVETQDLEKKIEALGAVN